MRSGKFSFPARLLSSSRAYALVGVIVLGGVLAYTSVQSLSRSNTRRLAIQDLKARFEQAATLRHIQKIFSNGGACKNTLGTSVSYGKVINKIKNFAGQDKFEVGEYYGRGTVYLKSIELSGLSGQDVSMDVTLERYNTFSRRSYASTKKSYALSFQGNASAITDCALKGVTSSPGVVEMTSEELCKTIYNAHWNSSHKCSLRTLGVDRPRCPDSLYDGVISNRQVFGRLLPGRFIEDDEVFKGFDKAGGHICCGTTFYPAANQVCNGKAFQQKNNCGSVRSAIGTADCTAVLNTAVTCSSIDCAGIVNNFNTIIPNHTAVPSCFCSRKMGGVIRWVEVGRSPNCTITCSDGVNEEGQYGFPPRRDNPTERVDHNNIPCNCGFRNGFRGYLLDVVYDVDLNGNLIDPVMRFTGCNLVATDCPAGRAFIAATCQCGP